MSTQRCPECDWPKCPGGHMEPKAPLVVVTEYGAHLGYAEFFVVTPNRAYRLAEKDKLAVLTDSAFVHFSLLTDEERSLVETAYFIEA